MPPSPSTTRVPTSRTTLRTSPPPPLTTPEPAAPPAGRSLGRQLSTALGALGWLLSAVLALFALLRLVAWDKLWPTAMLDAGTVWIYLPAWLVLGFAAFTRRWLLAGLSVLVVVAHLAFALPELVAASPAPAWTATAPKLRLLDANVNSGNESMAGYAAQIRAERPDLVTMEEASPADSQQLADDGVLSGLTHRIQLDRYDPRALFVASRYPLADEHVVLDGGVPLAVEANVLTPSGSVHLIVVHTSAPLRATVGEWSGELSAIGKLVRAGGLRRLLLVGDFNATWGNAGFRRILGLGLTDAAAARGQDLSMTWSQLMSPLPPLLRLDHVLTGSELAVTQITTGAGPGSDHRDLRATVAIRP
ncbi:MAG: Endonuclease/exonuclease/phosphatase [Acidimicrobiaceae bacterium]|nr:Endonuclease/exonuclease/phosphatase [Acidimicrobiaceae bacterium]